MTTTAYQSSFYVTGGTLHRNAPSYVERRADDELYRSLKDGNFCYLLTSRQMGKSSLMVRTAIRLRQEGVSVAVLDLTAIGQNLTVDQWFDGLIMRTGQQLDIEDELEDFWLDHQRISSLQRWILALQDVVLKRFPGQVVIFVDEIDAVRSLPFSTDEFFAGIRELYNRRSMEPELERLTFCLLGVATPTDLIKDIRTTPFNIGQRIELSDFNETEAAPLAKGLGREDQLGSALLGRVIHWTGGHPYLTQRLCQAVADDHTIRDARGVDRICESLFLSATARERDDNLLFVRERILKSDTDVASLLTMYEQVRRGRQVKDDETNPLVSILNLSGITTAVDGNLRVRNQIYNTVFDGEWIKANMPDAEVRRQKAAYRKGVWRAIGYLGIVLLLVTGLAGIAVRQRHKALEQQAIAEQQRAEAEQQGHRAEVHAELARQNFEKATAALKDAEEQKRIAQEQRQIAVNQQRIAEKERAFAEEQRMLAIAAREAAEAQRRVAQEREKVAEERRLEIEALRKIEDQRELAIWQATKERESAELAEQYLGSYPNGRFAAEARSLIASANSTGAKRAAVQKTPEKPHTVGAIAGNVIDADSKAAIASARVIITNESSGLRRGTTARADGFYLIPGLPVGVYTIEISHPGYQAQRLTGFRVSLNMITEVKFPGGALVRNKGK